MKVNAIRIHTKDQVVTVVEAIEAGQTVKFVDGENVCEIFAVSTIPPFHKMAIQPIPKGEDIYKYGERIGYATQDIRLGEHVHTHNLESGNL